MTKHDLSIYKALIALGTFFFLQSNIVFAESFVIVEAENQSPYMRGFPVPPEKIVDSDISWALDKEKAKWAFQNLSKVVRVEPVSRGNGSILALPYRDGTRLNDKFMILGGNSLNLRDLLKSMDVDGFIALKNGEIVTEAYYNGLTPDKRHIAFSVTKSLVGTLAGILIHEGLLDPNEQITTYLPELKGKAIDDATIRHALDMTLSLEWSMNRLDPQAEVNLNSAAGGFTKKPHDFQFSNTLDLIKSVKQKDEHGLTYTYNPANTEILGWAITRVLKQNWQEAFAERVWSKLGAERDAFIVVNEAGHGFATAGFNATLRDLARFGLMMSRNGYFNGHQIVPKAWIEDIRNGDSVARQAWQDKREKRVFGKTAYYRNQFRVLDYSVGEFMAMGAMGQSIYINMDNDLVGVFLSTTKDRMTPKAGAGQVAIMRQLNNVIEH